MSSCDSSVTQPCANAGRGTCAYGDEEEYVGILWSSGRVVVSLHAPRFCVGFELVGRARQRQEPAAQLHRLVEHRQPRVAVRRDPRKALGPPLAALQKEGARCQQLRVVEPSLPRGDLPLRLLILRAEVQRPARFCDDDWHVWPADNRRLVSVDKQPLIRDAPGRVPSVRARPRVAAQTAAIVRAPAAVASARVGVRAEPCYVLVEVWHRLDQQLFE